MNRSETMTKLIPALIAAQKAMGPAVKTAFNPHYKTRYVDLEGAWEACREALWANGLTVIQTTILVEGQARLITTLVHESGEWVESEYPLRPVKDDPQGLGAAMSYARRYSLMAIVGLAPEDDDGQTASRATRSSHEQPHSPTERASESLGPRLGTTTTKTRERFANWIAKIIDRWSEAEPLGDETDRRSREFRIAHALLTEAGPEIERLTWKPAEAGKEPVRDPKKVWEIVHRLAAGDWEWTKQATLKHLKKHVAETPKTQDEPQDVLQGV